MRTTEKFMKRFRGLPNNILTTACTRTTSGVDYSKCAKIDMADAYAKRDYGIGRVEIEAIDLQVVRMYMRNEISAAQSLVVFRWLLKQGLIKEEDRRDRKVAH